jgi:hypothetical protein
MATIKTHTMMIDEILFDINKSTDVKAALRGAMLVPYFKKYMELAVSEKWTTIDVKDIKFKQHGYHRSMAGALLLNNQTWKIIDQIIMTAAVKNSSKVGQFKALSEMLWEGESKVLTAVLTKDITSLYENIKFEDIVKALNDAA